MCQFVPNFLSYVSAKYFLNWFTVGKIITKTKGVNFLLRHSVYFYNKKYVLDLLHTVDAKYKPFLTI